MPFSRFDPFTVKQFFREVTATVGVFWLSLDSRATLLHHLVMSDYCVGERRAFEREGQSL